MDRYLKTVISLIAIFLGILVFERVLVPEKVQAQAVPVAAGNFEHIQFAASSQLVYLFNSNTGEVWIYDLEKKKLQMGARITKPGGPIAVTP